MSHEQTIKNAAISARILAHVAGGMELREAYDTVLGAGAFDAVAESVWAKLKSKA